MRTQQPKNKQEIRCKQLKMNKLSSGPESLPNFESWAIEMQLVAYQRSNPDKYIKAQAKAARKSWGKRESVTTRKILKLLEHASNPGEVLRRTSDFYLTTWV